MSPDPLRSGGVWVLQVTESWAGPGNEATISLRLEMPLMKYMQARSQDFLKGGYIDVYNVYRYAYKL